jgi:hypothetical protein
VIDQRRDSTGEPLGEIIDVSFLDPNGPEKSFMYSAQISCVITGSDMHKSVAYMFVENCFDSKDSVQDIERLRRGEEDYCVYFDPFTRGFSDADKPVRDPEELFLLLLRIRVDQISNEWMQNIAKLQRSFDKYEPVLVCYPRECELCRFFVLFLSVDMRPGAYVSFLGS